MWKINVLLLSFLLVGCSNIEPYAKPKVTLQKDFLNDGKPQLIGAVEIGVNIK